MHLQAMVYGDFKKKIIDEKHIKRPKEFRNNETRGEIVTRDYVIFTRLNLTL